MFNVNMQFQQFQTQLLIKYIGKRNHNHEFLIQFNKILYGIYHEGTIPY